MTKSDPTKDPEFKRVLGDLFRSFFWFETDELQEIAAKIAAQKWRYEARWEAEVLLPLICGIPMAFLLSIWLGIAYLWAFKGAIQSLNKKRFFDPLP
jgi:hypothetical protein